MVNDMNWEAIMTDVEIEPIQSLKTHMAELEHKRAVLHRDLRNAHFQHDAAIGFDLRQYWRAESERLAQIICDLDCILNELRQEIKSLENNNVNEQ
jgi:hypothetical protein